MNKSLVVGAALGALVAKLAGGRRRRRGSGSLVTGALLGALVAYAAPRVGVNLPLLGAGAR